MTPPARHDRTRSERRAAEVQHRRAQARARAERGRRARRRQHLRVGAAVLVVVLLVGLGVALVLPGDDGASATDLSLHGDLVSETGGVLPITAAPATYHVIYRIDSIVDGKTSSFTEDLTVRRPFDGHLVVRSGTPPGTDVQYDVTSVLGRTADVSDPASPVVNEAPPTLAVGDVRLDASLQDLVDSGLFVPRERRRVLDRECQVYRTGSSPESQALNAPTASDYVDVCVDDAGLMVEELTVASGAVAQRVTATTVDVAPVVGDDAFVADGDPQSLADGGSEVTTIDAATPPEAGQWTFAEAPAGFTLQGRYVVTSPVPPPDTTATTLPGATTTVASGDGTLTSTFDVWVDGADVIIVEQGTLDAQGTVDPAQGTTVQLGAMGEGTATPGSGGTVLLAHPDAGRFVRITATRPSAETVTLASALSRR